MNNDFIIKTLTRFNKDKLALYAYLGNEKIVTVPEGVVKICGFAFADENNPNDTIEKIILPDSLEEIESCGFAFCRALKKICWPNNTKFRILSMDLFLGCDSLKELEIPQSVSKILRIIIPKNVKKITIHDNIDFIDESSFVYEDRIKSYCNKDTIKILLSNPNYKIIKGFMVNLKHKMALFHVARNKKTVHIPDGIVEIAPVCFNEYGYFDDNCSENAYYNREIVPIEKVIIPESVKSIHAGAFYHCQNLKKVVYEGNSSDIEINREAFENCEKMELVFPKVICRDTPTDPKKQGLRICVSIE